MTVSLTDHERAVILDQAHETVIETLARIDAVVQERVPGVQVSAGRSQGPGHLLFTYRRYAPGRESRIDPVVAGVTVRDVDGGFTVEGDVRGEALGDILFGIRMAISHVSD